MRRKAPRRVAASASGRKGRGTRSKSRVPRRPSPAQRSTRAHLGRGIPSWQTLYLKRLTKLADTVSRFFTEPYTQGPKWARKQALFWRNRFAQYLKVAPPGTEQYTRAIKERVDGLPWDTPAA